ncbi:hypothetical protein PC128_g24066 [Phytophthora cactorum]|nr:hypothetical protein PC128_g24066 [Phytophthora cactorum]
MVCGGWIAAWWHWLKSLSGGKAQQLHREFPLFETMESIIHHDWAQASAFIALEDVTKLLSVPNRFEWVCKQDQGSDDRDCNNPEKDEIAKKRKKNSDNGGQCDRCGRRFPKKSTLTVHKLSGCSGEGGRGGG